MTATSPGARASGVLAPTSVGRERPPVVVVSGPATSRGADTSGGSVDLSHAWQPLGSGTVRGCASCGVSEVWRAALEPCTGAAVAVPDRTLAHVDVVGDTVTVVAARNEFASGVDETPSVLHLDVDVDEARALWRWLRFSTDPAASRVFGLVSGFLDGLGGTTARITPDPQDPPA